MTDYNYETGEFTDPGYITALNYLKEFNDKGYFNNGVNSMIHDVASENFKAGKAAMFYCETGEFGGLVDQGLEIGVFPMPDVEGNGDKGYIVGAPDGFMISTKSAHPEAGMELLKLFTSNEWQSKMVEELYYPSPIIGVHNEQNTIPSLLEAMNYIENAKGLANWLDTDVHTKVSDAYLPAMQEMLNGTQMCIRDRYGCPYHLFLDLPYSRFPWLSNILSSSSVFRLRRVGFGVTIVHTSSINCCLLYTSIPARSARAARG